jgi:hypothetical protein
MRETVPAKAARPQWVLDALTSLHLFEGELRRHREQLEEVALWLKGQHVNSGELADATHDLDHAELHIAAMRRSLDMAWPDEDRG